MVLGANLVPTFRTPENPHRGLIPKSPKFGCRKMAIFGDLDETFVPKKCQFGGCTVPSGPQFPPRHRRWRRKFKILGPGDQYSEVWYYTFRLRRPPNSGICIIHM